MPPLFADRATSCAYQNLALKIAEIERQNTLGLFAGG